VLIICKSLTYGTSKKSTLEVFYLCVCSQEHSQGNLLIEVLLLSLNIRKFKEGSMLKKIILVVLFMGFILFLNGESLWKESNLFSTRTKLKPGDIVKINFNYKNIVRYRNNMKTGSSKKINLAKPSLKLLSFLPDFDYSMSVNNNTQVDYSTEKEFSIILAVRTVAVNGQIISIQGKHTILVNGNLETIQISGVLRLADLYNGNVIHSHDIANLKFDYQGPSKQKLNSLTAQDLIYQSTNSGATNGNNVGTTPTLSDATKKRLIRLYLNNIMSLLFSAN